MQTVAELRAACGRLACSQETFPFGPTTLVWKVGGKVYALSGITGDPLKLSLKVRPAHGDGLRAAHAAIVPGYHLNKRHWVTLTLDGSLPDALVGELLAGSHALVVAGLTRAARAELGLISEP